MKSVFVALSLVCAGALLAGCETTSSMPYQASTQNVIGVQNRLKASDAKVRLGLFTAAPGVDKPTCRAAGQLDVAPGKSLEGYIRDALQTELFMAGVYDESKGATISGRVEKVDVNTFGTGSWSLTMSVSSTADAAGYTVSNSYPFASSFSAVSACQNAATAFNPAVQELLGKVVNHPGFSRLAGASQ